MYTMMWSYLISLRQQQRKQLDFVDFERLLKQLTEVAALLILLILI